MAGRTRRDATTSDDMPDNMTSDMASDMVCLGVIGSTHGVRGAVKVKTFTQSPQDLNAYGPLTDEKGERVFVVTSCAAAKAGARITLKGIDSREAAAALNGTGLYVARAKLPPVDEDDVFYHADLIGLAVMGADGAKLGEVAAMHNFGAGDLLEIKGGPFGGQFFPFTKAVVPQLDLAARQLTLVPPKEQEAHPPEQMAPEQMAPDEEAE